jgi:probable rRNA maturation factor
MNLQIKNNQKIVKIDKRKIRQALKTVTNHLGCSDKYISVSFVDDNEIRVLNKNYLAKNRPTNVLSFSMQENDYGGINPQVLGDIVISAQTAKKDARKGGLTVNQEIDFLLIHGLLHLLGFNHEKTTKDKAKKMEQKEKELFHLLHPKTHI